jgi:GxxExxY protein
MDVNLLTGQIIGAAIEVHRHLGPGLLETAYEHALAYEFDLRKVPYERQKPLPVLYKGVRLSSDLRLDFLVDEIVIVELKAIAELIPIHSAQIMTYLKISGCKVGLLMNFNVKMMKLGIKRFANHL